MEKMFLAAVIVGFFARCTIFAMESSSDVWVKIIACSGTAAKNSLHQSCTALHALSSKNNVDIYLQDPLVLSKHQGEYALMLCAYKNNVPAVKNLLLHNAWVYYHYCGIATSPLAIAYHNQNEALIKLLNSYSFFNDNDGIFSPVLPACVLSNAWAAFFGDTQAIAKYISSDNYNPLYFEKQDKRTNFPGSTLLKLALYRGHHNAVELLLSHPKTIRHINSGRKRSDRPIDIAFFRGDINSIQRLVAIPSLRIKGAQYRFDLLYNSVQRGCTECVRFLLGRYHFSINALKGRSLLNVFGDTGIKALGRFFVNIAPLTMAAYQGNKDIVAMLLQCKKIDVNIPVYRSIMSTLFYLTPLYAASLQGHVHVVEQLLAHSAINPCLYMEKYTPLHVACKKGYVDIVRMLVKHSPALLHMKTIDTNESPYKLAYHANQGAVVELLLKMLFQEKQEK